MEDWAEIRRLRRVEGMAISVIARRLGIARNTVKKALGSAGPPRYVRASKGSIADAVEPAVRELLQGCPTMPATVIAERIGWDRSITVLKDRVRQLRPYYLPPDPASRTEYDPGERAQCDLWFPPAPVPVGFGHTDSPPVLVMVSGYSRMIFAWMIPTRAAPDLIAGHWALLQQMGAVPKELVWDNEGAVGSWRAGKPKLAEEFEAFRGTLGISVHQCRPRDPEAKGLVERVNGYFETSFLPGRDFTSLADFNTQMSDWLPRANIRTVRALKARPVDLLGIDKTAMLALPPLPPPAGLVFRVRLPRDYYVRVHGNDYSVHPTAIGRMVDVLADLELVSVRLEGRLIAEHPRSWGHALTITDPDHVIAAGLLREAFQHPLARTEETDVLLRDLADYDTAFGVDIEVA